MRVGRVRWPSKQARFFIRGSNKAKAPKRRGRLVRLLPMILCALLIGTLSALAGDEERASFAQERKRMVLHQLESRGISDRATLRAMQTVPRHLFVPPRYTRAAYQDSPLPIGYAQTISQPYMVAYMTEQARPHDGQRALEVGTGSGYQAAILAEAGASVFTIEIVPELARSAAERLERLGYKGIKLRQGDGYFGWEEYAPYDVILVTAAAQYIPPPLLQQLKVGGRMIIPVGSPFSVQTLMLVEKTEQEVRTRSLMPVRFVPFRRTE